MNYVHYIVTHGNKFKGMPHNGTISATQTTF